MVKKEADAERRAAEARQYHAFYARELAAARRERITFRKLSRWQHAATYLLYFVMLMNIFVTTFGISGSAQDLFVARPVNASSSQWDCITVTPQSSNYTAQWASVVWQLSPALCIRWHKSGRGTERNHVSSVIGSRQYARRKRCFL